MLAFDIETTGLAPGVDEVTCICACDPEAGLALTVIPGLTALEFAELDGVLPGLGVDPEAVFRALDRADRVCAFNGARFDIPFLCRRFRVPPERAGAWLLKLVDVYEATYQAFDRAFGLNALLRANGFPPKTDSGANAVQMAQRREWRSLAEYCMADTVKTLQVSGQDSLALPMRGLPPVRLAGGRFVPAPQPPGQQGAHGVGHAPGDQDAVPAPAVSEAPGAGRENGGGT